VAPLAAAGSSPHERFLARIRDLGFAPSHILDVGANEGHWAQMVAGVFNASAPNILCVEGSQHRAEALRQKQATFAISVVGATPGLVHWYDASNAGMAHTGNSVLRENTRFFSGVKPVRVPVRTLDQVVADYEQLAGSRVVPGLVKVDVQVRVCVCVCCGDPGAAPALSRGRGVGAHHPLHSPRTRASLTRCAPGLHTARRASSWRC
jgi:FkbM family methyltransferase